MATFKFFSATETRLAFCFAVFTADCASLTIALTDLVDTANAFLVALVAIRCMRFATTNSFLSAVFATTNIFLADSTVLDAVFFCSGVVALFKEAVAVTTFFSAIILAALAILTFCSARLASALAFFSARLAVSTSF